MSPQRDPELAVPSAASLFKGEELQRAQAEWNRRLAACTEEQRPFLIMQYANPVLNQYRLKQAEAAV
ncbi:hypothetical protein FQZ97_1055870 [compost metagenome]